MNSPWLAGIEECFWPKGFRRDIWMIVDAARDRRIFPMLLDLCLEYSCLLGGPLAPALELAAPYLVQLEFDDKKTRSLIRQGWGNSWGVFLKCDERLDTLRRHLRGFLKVRDPRGGRMFFRYYDPRVLRLYLPTCNAEELRTVFGPIERFWMEDETPGTMLAFDFAHGQLVRKQLILDSGEQLDKAGPAHPGPDREARVHRLPLAIREEQFTTFSRAAIRAFEDRMVIHLRKFFPSQCEYVGEPRLREMIRHGIRQSATYGITAERDVCRYINVMMVLGRDFDMDKQFEWAGEILKQSYNAAAKVQVLHDEAVDHLKRR